MSALERSALRQITALAIILTVITAAAAWLGGHAAGLWCLATSVAALAFSCAVAFRRHREMRRLAAELDEVLHSGRLLRLSDYHEGDLAILRNELEKMVTRLVRLSDQLAAEKSALADALADISHQIRTPLTAAELMITAIERSGDAQERKHMLRDLEELLDRISWLVATLLKIAKVDAGAFPLEMRPITATAVVARALSPLEVALDLRGIQLELQVPASVGFTGDELWCAEALENIVKNCMEHTPAGGRITITASEDALTTRITVEDTGPGIAAEDLPHLFERFYRGSLEERESEGFGLGLALAQALVSAQGGTLRATNVDETGENATGARFEAAFPKLCV